MIGEEHLFEIRPLFVADLLDDTDRGRRRGLGEVGGTIGAVVHQHGRAASATRFACLRVALAVAKRSCRRSGVAAKPTRLV